MLSNSFRPAVRAVARGALCLIVGLFASTAQAALMKYSYTGVDFTTNGGIYTNSSNITVPCDPIGAGPCDITNISAEIVIDELGTNQAFGVIAPVSWQISDGRTTVTSDTPGWSFFGGPLRVGTDGSGDIDEWYLQILTDDFSNTAAGELTQIRTIDTGGFVNDQTSYCQTFTTECTAGGNTGVSTFAPNHLGTWTATVIPVPAAFWLFAPALGLLGFMQRRSA